MAASPVFELFEVICMELAAQPVQVIPEDRLDNDLLESVMEQFDETSMAEAFRRAMAQIDTHFQQRGAGLPYRLDMPTRQFHATDPDFLEFVAFCRNRRGVGGPDSKDFEIRSLRRLRKRVTGDLYRVGVPRDRLRRKRQIVAFLKDLGFEANALDRYDQDGGLDILWLPPLGSVPMRPIISLQCKNSFFDESEANSSSGRAERTLRRHSHIKADHLKFVIFNDYIDRDRFEGRAAGWTFLPLGLTDLASLVGPGLDDAL